MFGGANAFLETRLGSDSDDLRTFGDGSGRRLRQGRSGRRIIDLRYDDVPLLADGVQSDNSQNLLGRLALPPLVTPLVGANEGWRDLGSSIRSGTLRRR